jgi:hypothetical protein
MQKLNSILLAGIILLASMSNAVVYFAFKINQAGIAEVFCINKDKPSLHCDGKCYLHDRLAESNDKNNQSSPFTHFEETLRITFFHQWPETLAFFSFTEKKCPGFEYSGLLSQPYLKSFLHPPERQLPSC